MEETGIFFFWKEVICESMQKESQVRRVGSMMAERRNFQFWRRVFVSGIFLCQLRILCHLLDDVNIKDTILKTLREERRE